MKRLRQKWTLLILLILLVLLVMPKVGAVEAGPIVEAVTTEQHNVDTKQSEQQRSERLRQFEQISEQLYQDMQQGNTQDANNKMNELIDALEGLSFKGLTSVEGIHALAETIMDAKETVVRAQLDPEDWVISSARLRLAVNSLTHKEKALWLQYYKVMADDLQVMNKARAGGSPAQFKKGFQSLQSHYDVIRPAAAIRRDPSDMNQFDSWMSYVAGLTRTETWDENAIRDVMSHGDQLIKDLFGRKSDEPVFLPITGYSSPWYWTLLIGAWIVVALIYTAYRKYNANQNITSLHDKRDRADSYRY
ncbi:sporulation protein YpjB [Fontibacillus panacisegetis]|uniref:Sporulation protein YpjB n=1 Tax=Fontibacillus panacisegetis TaxID=670482 RepID=A0A1G7KZI7_9BACL|nr:sporulation protein YpjB [Fontibacillus panacisegetis]SDF42648.1 sporulation protein YpjB [Fontibacillus panacisegetis]